MCTSPGAVMDRQASQANVLTGLSSREICRLLQQEWALHAICDSLSCVPGSVGLAAAWHAAFATWSNMLNLLGCRLGHLLALSVGKGCSMPAKPAQPRQRGINMPCPNQLAADAPQKANSAPARMGSLWRLDLRIPPTAAGHRARPPSNATRSSSNHSYP